MRGVKFRKCKGRMISSTTRNYYTRTATKVLVRSLGPIGALRVAPDLELEHGEAGTKAGEEQVVQELAALRLRIFDQQPRRAPRGRARRIRPTSACRRW